VVCRLPEEQTPGVGETLRVTAEAAKIHIFDAKTDARLS
jgi:hypothetical protein